MFSYCSQDLLGPFEVSELLSILKNSLRCWILCALAYPLTGRESFPQHNHLPATYSIRESGAADQAGMGVQPRPCLTASCLPGSSALLDFPARMFFYGCRPGPDSLCSNSGGAELQRNRRSARALLWPRSTSESGRSRLFTACLKH